MGEKKSDVSSSCDVTDLNSGFWLKFSVGAAFTWNLKGPAEQLVLTTKTSGSNCNMQLNNSSYELMFIQLNKSRSQAQRGENVD